MKPRILLTEPLDADAETRLDAAATVIRPQPPSEDEFCRAVAGCDALIARSSSKITRRVLESAPKLRVIGCASVGTDHVDLAAAAERGITVLNTPLANADAAAEFTVALMLQLLRPIPRLAAAYAAGNFAAARREPHGVELRELTVGIVGMGRVGSRVGRICAAGFGASVLYNDIIEVGPFPFPASRVEKPILWSTCDIITLHTPLTDADPDRTRGLIDAAVLRQFKLGAFLINAARGAIIRTDDLVAALRAGAPFASPAEFAATAPLASASPMPLASGCRPKRPPSTRLAAAALDVTDPEPLPPNHPLWSLPNCLLTPHVAARTHGGLRRMYAIVDDVLAYLHT